MTDKHEKILKIARTICDHERGRGAWETMIATLVEAKSKRPGPAEARFLSLAAAIVEMLSQTGEV